MSLIQKLKRALSRSGIAIGPERGVNILSGIKSDGDLSINITDTTINGVDIVGGTITINGRQVSTVDGRRLTLNFPSRVSITALKSDQTLIVNGNIEATTVTVKGNLNCNDIHGNVSSSHNVNCDDIKGNLSAGGNVNCNGIGGNVQVSGNLNTKRK